MNLLRYYMAEHKDTSRQLARAMGLHYNTLCLKLQGKNEFTREEIKFIMDRYKFTSTQLREVFFN